jgi:hypothetical protein
MAGVNPDIFLSYNRDDQATARRFAEAFEAQGFNVWWDVTLRSAEPYLTLEAVEGSNAIVFPAQTAKDLNSTFRKVWLETPLDPAAT